MNKELTTDAVAAIRHAKHGTLPERIRLEAMSEEVEAAPDGEVNASYNPEGSWNRSARPALDLGLQSHGHRLGPQGVDRTLRRMIPYATEPSVDMTRFDVQHRSSVSSQPLETAAR
ncbi:hypothetical protein [Streptomyces sp. NPDC048411]|uniref:hypothetical protein n=1 Tax=Streptomyces sp. NPDC048411 TaxID=3157206 RepID=UPI0034527C64